MKKFNLTFLLILAILMGCSNHGKLPRKDLNALQKDISSYDTNKLLENGYTLFYLQNGIEVKTMSIKDNFYEISIGNNAYYYNYSKKIIYKITESEVIIFNNIISIGAFYDFVNLEENIKFIDISAEIIYLLRNTILDNNVKIKTLNQGAGEKVIIFDISFNDFINKYYGELILKSLNENYNLIKDELSNEIISFSYIYSFNSNNFSKNSKFSLSFQTKHLSIMQPIDFIPNRSLTDKFISDIERIKEL